MNDLISRQTAKEAYCNTFCHPGAICPDGLCKEVNEAFDALPSAEPETCEGCKHLGKWENEVEYGYPSPCTRCKRRVEDHYER